MYTGQKPSFRELSDGTARVTIPHYDQRTHEFIGEVYRAHRFSDPQIKGSVRVLDANEIKGQIHWNNNSMPVHDVTEQFKPEKRFAQQISDLQERLFTPQQLMQYLLREQQRAEFGMFQVEWRESDVRLHVHSNRQSLELTIGNQYLPASKRALYEHIQRNTP